VRLVGLLPAALAVALVLTVYTFFSSSGTMEYRRLPVWWLTYYSSQAEGFLRGHTNLEQEPDPRLLALRDPYIFDARKDIPYMWDVSLYKGKYYLYFSPVPVLLFTIPYRLVSGGYPGDDLSSLVFCAWAFLAAVAFLWRVKQRSPLFILLVGLGSVFPFVLVETRIYEVASFCAMAMAVTWAYMLLRFFETPTPRWAALMGLFLGLTIVTRPNTIVLLAIAACALWKEQRRAIIAALIPLVLLGSAAATYNYIRFGSPFETGMSYQLTAVPMQHERPCSLCTRAEGMRFMNTFMHYVFFPPKYVSKFPYADLRWNDVDPTVSFPVVSEQVGGIVALTPVTMLGTLVAALLLLARRAESSILNPQSSIPSVRTAMLLLAAAWLVLLTLSTCRWLNVRYSLDFYALMLLGALVMVEQGLVWLREAGVRTAPLRAFIALVACYSIVTGVLLGFNGRNGVFKRLNPERFEAIRRMVR
jgi:hypothetical protein